MKFMNQYEIDHAVARTNQCDARGKAARLLYAHADVIGYHSDGWAHWRAPMLAARRLMEVVQAPPGCSELTLSESLRMALSPLKAFYTKHPQIPRPEILQELSKSLRNPPNCKKRACAGRYL
jgi:hypothetical protein